MCVCFSCALPFLLCFSLFQSSNHQSQSTPNRVKHLEGFNSFNPGLEVNLVETQCLDSQMYDPEVAGGAGGETMQPAPGLSKPQLSVSEPNQTDNNVKHADVGQGEPSKAEAEMAAQPAQPQTSPAIVLRSQQQALVGNGNNSNIDGDAALRHVAKRPATRGRGKGKGRGRGKGGKRAKKEEEEEEDDGFFTKDDEKEQEECKEEEQEDKEQGGRSGRCG